VGVTFNLCHWLKQDGPSDLESRLKLALPRLMLVTINGADPEGGWDRIIQTLDRGSYDVCDFLKTLRRVGYRGPIGLQCYAIAGNKRDNLARSMKTWQEYCRRLASKQD
jgi:sugar phosphate isomerase/epimerase